MCGGVQKKMIANIASACQPIVPVTAEDAETYRRLGAMVPIHVAPVGLEAAAVPDRSGQGERATIVFLADQREGNRRSWGVVEKGLAHPPTPLPPYPPTVTGSLATTIAHVLRELIERQGVRAFNLAIALPPLGLAAAEWPEFPIVARIGDRGNPLSERSDIGAMELFAAGCVTADPFEVAAALRQAPGDN